jgi:hypothetical protein
MRFARQTLRPPPRICSQRKAKGYTGGIFIMCQPQVRVLLTTRSQSGQLYKGATKSIKCVAASCQATSATDCAAATVWCVTTKAQWKAHVQIHICMVSSGNTQRSDWKQWVQSLPSGRIVKTERRKKLCSCRWERNVHFLLTVTRHG